MVKKLKWLLRSAALEIPTWPWGGMIIFVYQKALTVFKFVKAKNHPSIAAVFVCLADVNCNIGKWREATTLGLGNGQYQSYKIREDENHN